MTPMLEVNLFGPIEATFDGRPLPRPQRLRTGALWACLMLNARTPLARERAAFMIWPDLTERDARAELRRHLHWLARYLNTNTGSSVWLVRDQGRIGWSVGDASNGGAFQSDTERFEKKYGQIVATLRDNQAILRADLVGAIELQRDDLLSEMWDEWIGPYRRRFRSELEHLLELLLAHDESTGDLAGALATGRRLLELDRFREESHRALMRLHAAAGDRAAATHQFHVCRALLREQLDVDPMPETLSLYRMIRAGSASQGGVRIAERSQFPMLPAGGHDSGGIPQPPTRFIGREDVVARLEVTLTRSELLTLVGPGGIGKSRLAIELCLRTAATADVPIRWVDLTVVPHGAAAAPVIADALGLPAETSDARSDAQDFERLCEHLRTSRLLLVLDGAEHLLENLGHGVSLLRENCPELRILVTSREPLGISGEVVRRIGPLRIDADEAGGPGEAVTLFAERARAASFETVLGPKELRFIADICRSLDGLPLAIELAAARAVSRSLEDIRDELSEVGSAAELRPMRAQDAPPSQRGVEGAFDWSYRTLSEDERSIIRAVSVFNGAFVEDDVIAIARDRGVTERTLLDVLQRLVTTSMIMVEPGPKSRYRMLGPLRAAAWKHASSAGEADGLVSAALEIIVRRAESIADSLESIRNVEPQSSVDPIEEHRRQRADLRWAMAKLNLGSQLPLALRLAAASWRPWSLDGAEEAERKWVAELLDRADRVPAYPVDELPVARARFAAGVLAYQHAEPEAARRNYEAALEVFRRHGDTSAIRTTLDHLTVVLGVLGEREEALVRCEESIVLKADAPAAERADTIAIRGDLHMRIGDIDAASADYESALATLRHAPGRRRSLLNVLRGLGIIALRKSRPLDAASYFSEGLEISRSWNDRAGCAVWLNELGCLDMERGELETATLRFKEALEIHRVLGAGQRTAMLLNNLGELAIQQDDYVLARYYFMHSLRHARHAPDDPRRINTLTNLAEAHAYLGEVLRARQTADEAFELALAKAIPTLIHHARSAQGLAALMAGDSPSAAHHFGNSAAGWWRDGHEDRARSVLELGALALAEHGDLKEAFIVLDAAHAGRVAGRTTSALEAWSSFQSPFAKKGIERLLRTERRALSGPEVDGTPTLGEAVQRLIAWASRARAL